MPESQFKILMSRLDRFDVRMRRLEWFAGITTGGIAIIAFGISNNIINIGGS